MELTELKKEYSLLQKKYKLPGFKEINENFEIDKIDRETDTLLRLIRKVMMEKIANSMAFLEMIANPANAPRVYLTYIKAIGQSEKEDMEKLFAELGGISIKSIELEINYSEKKEAEAIKTIFETWSSVKPSFSRILVAMTSKQENNGRKEKSYYG